MSKPKVIAFYLPQFHPTENNNKWWGTGFTEWTNVGKAKPLFKGHNQPRVPADLGYYDLRLPEVRLRQAELAKYAGIDAFCYYHYWFGNGRRELNMPFDEVLRLGEPDFPFCLCWANESWHSKFWNMDGTITKKTLVEQLYPGDEDVVSHFEALLPAFQDVRYMRINDRPIFMIYKPFEYEQVSLFIEQWQKLAKQNGLEGIYFIAQISDMINEQTISRLYDIGFDAINTVGLWEARKTKMSIFQRAFNKIFNIPSAMKYEDAYPWFISNVDSIPNVYPTLIPNWDHTPRSGRAGYVLMDSTPELFREHIKQVFSVVKKKNDNQTIVFLKSWNEWGEGNYMEPDLKYGKQYLEVLKEEKENY